MGSKVKFELKGDRELIAILKKLEYKDMQKIYKKALTNSVKPLEREAKRSLRRTGIKNIDQPYIGRKNGRVYKSMLQGIKTSVDIRYADDNYAKVHIMGEFRLKWFEKGTSKRQTYKHYERGKIRARWFFKEAVELKGEECRTNLETNIKKSIQKVWERR